MPSFFGKSKIKKIVGEQRKSKIVSNAGCGALVDFPGFSGIMGGQNLWPNTRNKSYMKIHDKRLEEQLDRDYFLQVSSEEPLNWRNNEQFSIPVIRFPEFYYCPNCHELDYARRIAKNYRNDNNHIQPLKCSKCGNIDLIPSRFVLACSDGHIDDFPYSWWVHRGEKCENEKLKLEYKGMTGGLDSIKITCTTCKRSRTMANVINKDSTEGLKCRGNSPWLGTTYANCECNKPLRTLLRGSSNIYYPDQKSALTIPPWSNIIQKTIDEYLDDLKPAPGSNITEDEKLSFLKLQFKMKNFAKILNCTEAEFIKQCNLRFTNNNSKNVQTKDLEADEYHAFIDSDMDDHYFKTQETNLDQSLKPFIKKVKLVKRLREVKVLCSFKRISAYDDEGAFSAPLSNKKENWLPAAELLGEGIFIEFQHDKLKEWLKKVESNYAKMQERFNKRELYKNYGTFSPIKVALHTFSHLLMRELAYNCGYDAASINEKIYFSDDTNEKFMAGVLIYTASTCSDGSLGGLVRQGEEQRLKDSIFSMLNRAIWCSNDPICLESNEQGKDSLNYAACHACALVPEISCKYNNLLLDRKSIIGTFENRDFGYLGSLINLDTENIVDL